MGLKHGDLKDTVLSKISIDEFEPKTGESRDVVVMGLRVIENNVGQDLYSFLNSGIADIRDIEVSPNPNDDGHYMVFVEMDRNDETLNNIRKIVKDIENVAGNLKWKASTHLTDDYYPLNEDDIQNYFISNPEDYLTKDEWLAQTQAEAELESVQEEVSENCGCGNDPCDTLEFLKASNLKEASIRDGKLQMSSSTGSATLEIVKFGDAKEVMADIGISESAIKPLDSVMRKFNSMLGEMRAIPIDDYIVVFHPENNNVLVTKKC